MESLGYVALCKYHLPQIRIQQANYSLHRYKIVKSLLKLSKFFVHTELSCYTSSRKAAKSFLLISLKILNIRIITADTRDGTFPRSMKNYHKIDYIFSTIQTKSAGRVAYVGNVYESRQNNWRKTTGRSSKWATRHTCLSCKNKDFNITHFVQ